MKKVLFIIIIFLVIWSIISDSGVETREFPQLSEPKIVTFEWEYGGSNYSITETLYKTAYEYYNSEPKEYTCLEGYCPEGWEEDYVKTFLKKVEGDNTISQIASDIKTIGQRAKLDDDQIVELTVAFVQSISYDEAKAKIAEPLPRYPYEVLYDNKGICSGKSFLAASLIRELGYGVALFDYEYEEHIAPAVKCLKEYSSYNSGYCYTEITERGFKIGEMPEMDIDTKIPRIRTSINLFEEKNMFDLGGLELGDAEIYEIVDGNSYRGIIKTAQTIQRIETLEKELERLDSIINLLENELSQLENSVNYYDQQAEAAYRRHEILGDYTSHNEYRRLFSQYELAYDKYESRADEHDREVDRYNNFVYEYNALIEDFYK